MTSTSRLRGRSRAIAIAAASLLLLGLAAMLLRTGPPPASASSERPNIVFLLTDDQTKRDLNKTVMPRTMEWIRKKGVSFKRAYISTPLCCPARATFLTGQYAHNSEVRQNTAPEGGYERFVAEGLDETNLPVWLHGAGYHTTHIGKYLNFYGDGVTSEDDPPPEVPPGWDEWFGYVGSPSSRYWGYILNENGDLRQYGDPSLPDDQQDPENYQTDVYANLALEAIKDRAAAGPDAPPFYLNVNFSAPHQTAPPAPRHAGKFTKAALPKDPSYNEPGMSDKPAFLQAQTPKIGPGREFLSITKPHRRRLSTLYTVDTAVKKIVTKLKDKGLLSNTYVVFASDSGFFQGQHRLVTGKYLAYDPSARVPLVIRGPGIPRGETSGELVTNADFAPTVLDIGDASPNGGFIQDGRTLLPFAEEPILRTSRPLLIEGFGAGDLDQEPPVVPSGGASIAEASVGAPAYAAIRTQRWLYVEYGPTASYPEGAIELYDMKKDPYQLHSLHEKPAYETVRGVLALQLTKLRECKGGTSQTVPTSCGKHRSDPEPPG